SSPQVKDVTVTQQYVGQVRAHRYIKVRALQTGHLDAILVKEGQRVQKDQVIFKIVPVIYQAKLDIDLAEVKLAELEFRNAERLFKNNVVPISELALYKAKLDKAKAKAALGKIELDFTEMRAPFDGMIDRLIESRGSFIKEGETLTSLSDNSVL